MTTTDDSRLPVVREIVRDLFPHISYRVSRVIEGGSTWVYLLEGADQCLYLRVLPEEDASFAPEVAVHTMLRAAGVSVPEIVAWEHLHPALNRSVMVTTAIAGRDLRTYSPPSARSIIAQAGRDLALINQFPVAGYGWVRRDMSHVDALRGVHPSLSAWFADDVEPAFGTLQSSNIFSRQESDALSGIMRRAEDLFGEKPIARLAHGDFDLTHIFAADGAYTGIIDFGEVRGTYPLYDLGHFAIEQEALLPDLLSGYAEVTPLPSDYMDHLQPIMVLIAARRAGRWLARIGQVYSPDIAAIRRGLAARL